LAGVAGSDCYRITRDCYPIAGNRHSRLLAETDLDACNLIFGRFDRSLFRLVALNLQRHFVSPGGHIEKAIRFSNRFTIYDNRRARRDGLNIQLRRSLLCSLDILRAEGEHSRNEKQGVHNGIP